MIRCLKTATSIRWLTKNVIKRLVRTQNSRKTNMNKTTPSSTGGTITYTKTGLIHKAGSTYSGKLAALEAKNKPKKG